MPRHSTPRRVNDQEFMSEKENEIGSGDFNRRDFIRGASFSTLMAMMGGIPLQAAETNQPAGSTNFKAVDPPVNCAVIGCGVWGREILKTLAVLPNAPVTAICDTYEPWLNRAKKEAAPKAEIFKDYRQLLEQKSVEAVIVATPTQLHKDIVIAALQAGKHVYCEAPLANTVEDARAIAQAAKAAPKLYFQAGLQDRSDPQRPYVRTFLRSGAIGKNVSCRSQWHKKESGRRTAPSNEREQALNWRLQRKISTGLAGEIGIHQIDLMNWFLGQLPRAVTGFGGILSWNDGRDTPDTVQAVFQYPNEVNYAFEATLASNFDSYYEVLIGTYATVMMRGRNAWMFKEADSPTLGWEPYARKDVFFEETGIALSLDATKLTSLQKKPTMQTTYQDSPLHFALDALITNAHITAKGVENFTTNFGADADGLDEYLLTLKRKPFAGYQDGFDATVTAIKANEAILGGGKIELQKEWFQV